MSKDKLEDWDETAANNLDMGGISLAENVMRPPAVNNEMREHMAQVAKWLGDETLASAATTDLGSVPGRYISVTGTTTITGLGTIKAGTLKYVKFAGILTLTHNATSLILPSAANITTAAGDTAIFVSEGSGNWKCIAYQRVDGSPVSQTRSANIASAGTTNLATATGDFVHITGTTTITAFGTAPAGVERTIVFDGILTLTHNAASLILPGGGNIITAAGDSAVVRSEGSGNWKCVQYQRASVPASSLAPFATASPSSASSVLFSGLPAAVKSWRLEVINVKPATDSDNLGLRMSASGTPVATNYQSGLLRTDYDSATPVNTNTTTYMVIGATVGNATNEGVSCSAMIQNIGQSGFTFVHGTGSAINPAGGVRMMTFGGALLGATAYTEISIFFAGGNIASGELRLYAEWD